MKPIRLALVGIALLAGFTVEASNAINADTIANRLMYQIWSYPQEKLSIATDAEEYAAGDTIDMNIRLVDATTMRPSQLSRFAYIELSDPFGKVCKRVKLKLSEAEIDEGYLPLPSEMSEGIYTLTGYTRFMENTGPDYFFSKPIYIYGSGRPAINPSITFTRKGDNLRMTASVGDASKAAVIEISTPDGKQHSSLRKKNNFSVELKPEEWKKGVALTKIGNYGIFVPLPPDSTDLAVSMIPEGGTLVADNLNAVGIRVSDVVGRGMKLNGTLFDSKGDAITTLATDNHGYGSFKFMPEGNESYYVEICGKQFPLPIASDSASSLQVNNLRKDAVSVNVVGNKPQEAFLLVHCRGNLIHCSKIENDTPLTFKKSVLPFGINEVCLIDGNQEVISRRQFYVGPNEEMTLNFDADIPGFMTKAYGFKTNSDNIAMRTALDNMMLASGKWKRYDIPSAIKGSYESPSADLEIGGEISGIVKSRWRGKPVANAEVSIISSDIDFWNTTKTDNEGRFVINGVDWPEGTNFVVKVVNEKGDYEDNFSIKEESFPKAASIIPRFEGDVYTMKELDNSEIQDRLSKWLDEVEVTAMAKDEDENDISKIYEIIGGRTVDQDYFDHRSITNYEAAIRAFPGLLVEGGKVICAGGGRGRDVEIWVDGVKWVPPYDPSTSAPVGVSTARRQAAINTANTMTGGLIPSDLALAQYASNQSSLSDLAASFPFNNVEKIIYLRPGTALIVSNHAGFAGGALMIFTKNKNSGKYVDYDFHLKVISPLGYQKQK